MRGFGKPGCGCPGEEKGEKEGQWTPLLFSPSIIVCTYVHIAYDPCTRSAHFGIP